MLIDPTDSILEFSRRQELWIIMRELHIISASDIKEHNTSCYTSLPLPKHSIAAATPKA